MGYVICLLGTGVCTIGVLFNVYIGELSGVMGWSVAVAWTLVAASNAK